MMLHNLIPLLMMPAGDEGPDSGGGAPAPKPEDAPGDHDAPTKPEPGGIDWRARYEALEKSHHQLETKMTRLEQDAAEAAKQAAGEDPQKQLALAQEENAELKAQLADYETKGRHDTFMKAATKGVSEDKLAQVELMIRGELASNPGYAQGDPDLAAEKMRRSFQARGFGSLFETAKPKPEVPPITQPAKGKRDWSKVTTLDEIPQDLYGDIPDEHWLRLTR